MCVTKIHHFVILHMLKIYLSKSQGKLKFKSGKLGVSQGIFGPDMSGNPDLYHKNFCETIIEISFECYIRYQRNFQPVIKSFFYLWFAQLNLGYTFHHRVGGATYKSCYLCQSFSKMECIYWTYSINHHIPHWGMTFLTIQLATAWTNYAYS